MTNIRFTEVFEVDPTGHFGEKGATLQRLKEAAGVLPVWAAAALAEDTPTAKKVYDALVSFYPFYFGPMEDVTVDAEGLWVSAYPEDPDLYPITKQSRGGVSVYTYQYSLVAVTDGKETYATRMD